MQRCEGSTRQGVDGAGDRHCGLLPSEVLTLPFEDEHVGAGPVLPRPAAPLGLLALGPSPQSAAATGLRPALGPGCSPPASQQLPPVKLRGAEAPEGSLSASGRHSVCLIGDQVPCSRSESRREH